MSLKKNLTAALGLGALLLAGVQAADHIDAPFTTGESNADINDVYAFTRDDRLVLVMTVFPFADSTTRLNPDYLYQFKIDTDGDLLEDRVIQVSVSGTGDAQTYSVTAPFTPRVFGSQDNLRGTPAIEGSFNQIASDGDLTAFVGLRDDPFFFDLGRYLEILDDVRDNGMITGGGFNDPGSDTLGGANAIAIVVELPSSSISNGQIALWATSSRDDSV